jgi:hypothetical protein
MSGLVVGLTYVLLGELVMWMALTSDRPYSLPDFLAYWLGVWVTGPSESVSWTQNG